jgi:hypothetical protein
MVTMSRSLALGAIVAVGILVTSWANATAHPSDHPHLKRIADIQVGDEVLAWDELAAHDQRLEQQSYQKVTEVFNTPERIRTLVHLTLDNGQTLTATDGHPLKTEEGWRDPVLLKKGGKLLLKDFSYTTIWSWRVRSTYRTDSLEY